MPNHKKTMENLGRRANNLDGKQWLSNSFSIWRKLEKSPEEKKLSHPASFPISLVEKLIESYIQPEDKILLDPFAGSGNALIAALRSGMKSIGVDVNPEFGKMFEQRRGLYSERHGPHFLNGHCHYHIEDARTISSFVDFESVDISVTSPPYWDILNRKRTADRKKSRAYSDIEADLGNTGEYDEFISMFEDVIKQVFLVLKPKSRFIINVMDIRKGANFYPFHADTIGVAQKEGFVLEDIIIWDRQPEYNGMRPLGYPYKFIVNKVHEYILVFIKD